jgi:hypothetical protein
MICSWYGKTKAEKEIYNNPARQKEFANHYSSTPVEAAAVVKNETHEAGFVPTNKEQLKFHYDRFNEKKNPTISMCFPSPGTQSMRRG